MNITELSDHIIHIFMNNNNSTSSNIETVENRIEQILFNDKINMMTMDGISLHIYMVASILSIFQSDIATRHSLSSEIYLIHEPGELFWLIFRDSNKESLESHGRSILVITNPSKVTERRNLPQQWIIELEKLMLNNGLGDHLFHEAIGNCISINIYRPTETFYYISNSNGQQTLFVRKLHSPLKVKVHLCSASDMIDEQNFVQNSCSEMLTFSQFH